MFRNVGRQIKSFAKWVFYIQATVVTINTIYDACVLHDAPLSPEEVLYKIHICLILIGAGWFESVLLYGFGVIVEDHEKNAEAKGGKPVKEQLPQPTPAAVAAPPAAIDKGQLYAPKPKAAPAETKSANVSASAGRTASATVVSGDTWTCGICGSVNGRKDYSCPKCRTLRPMNLFRD